MAPREDAAPARSCPVEAIVRAYLTTTCGDAHLALRSAVTDAVADLMEAERKTRQQSRLISRGYVRGALGEDATETA